MAWRDLCVKTLEDNRSTELLEDGVSVCLESCIPPGYICNITEYDLC